MYMMLGKASDTRAACEGQLKAARVSLAEILDVTACLQQQ